MSIVIVRHGETALNRARVVQPADTPLNELGLSQARRLAHRLQGLGLRAILCSDLARARMTAAPVADLLGLEPEPSELLQERNFGNLRGTPYAEIGEDLFGPEYVPPAGESWPVFEERVARAWRQVVARAAELEVSGGGQLLVVTHGLVCHALMRRHWHLPAPLSAPGYWYNTGVTVVSKRAPYSVAQLNCGAHLQVTDEGGVSGI